LFLSRNIFFYKDLELEDTYETRIYLMFFHYSIVIYLFKKKGEKPDQENYNNLFFYIENNLRELGFGDVAVNKKMKDLNKIFYDILLKLSDKTKNFNINQNLSIKYFEKLKNSDEKRDNFNKYFTKFYNYCFELSVNNMIKEIQKFKF